MPQHLRESILDALVAELQKIGDDLQAPSQGWATSVVPVVQKLSQDALSLSQLPQILIVPQGERKTGRSSSGATRVVDSTFTVMLDCWQDSFNMSEDASSILHDIETALALNPSLSGACRDMQVTGNRTLLSEDQQPLTGLQVDVEIVYGVIDIDPTTLR